jgi:hypothetical protein
MGAYSAVPLKIYSSGYTTQQQFKYLVNVIWDTVTISADTSVNINTEVYTRLNSTSAHNFKVGDTILLDDTVNSNEFTGYYIVQAVISPTSFAIDLIPNAPFGASGFTCSRVLKWKLEPDLDGYGKIDLSTSLKDFVTQDLTGQTLDYALSYDGPNTSFLYSLYCGSQQIYNFRFDDNYFVGGYAGFVATGMTSTAGIPFQIGDTINVIQDVVQWPYVDNYFASNVGFTGTTAHSFLPGQQITVTGQETFPYYNGVTTIQSVSANALVTVKGWQGNTPAESGFIYGVPRPSYNRTANVVGISYIPGTGVVILTDIPWAGNSVAIPGSIRYADGRISEFPTQLKLTGKYVYNAHVDKQDYSLTAYDPYVIQNRNYTGNSISTILTQGNYYRIEKSTKAFLLAHADKSNLYEGVFWIFYDSNNTSLGSVKLVKPDPLDFDTYFPVGLEQIAQSSYTPVSGNFTTFSGSVASYEMFVYDNTNVRQTNSIFFKLNNDCSMYEIYHLMWKDKYGSFISYPFIYKSRTNIEVERQTYYKQEGNWNNNTFQYYDYGNGEKNFYIKSRKSFILNSGWLYQFETALIDDLMQSASVYIQTPEGRLFQCHIAQKEVELYKTINEDLFSYTFNVRVSNNEYRF